MPADRERELSESTLDEARRPDAAQTGRSIDFQSGHKRASLLPIRCWRRRANFAAHQWERDDDREGPLFYSKGKF